MRKKSLKFYKYLTQESLFNLNVFAYKDSRLFDISKTPFKGQMIWLVQQCCMGQADNTSTNNLFPESINPINSYDCRVNL